MGTSSRKGLNGRDPGREGEERLVRKGATASTPGTEWEMQRLVHELEVHRIQLEMQNEELRRAHRSAEEQRRRYRELYDLAPMGYVTLDRRGMIREGNAAVASLVGCQQTLLRNRPLASFLVPEAAVEFEAFLRRVLSGSGKERCELQLGTRAGRQGWLLLEGAAARVGDSRETFCRMALVDITERKRLEAALRKSEEMYSLIFNVASSIIGMTTFPEGKIVELNDAGLQSLGYRREEVMGKTTTELGIWADPEERSRMLRIINEEGAVRNFKMVFRERNGRLHDGLFSADTIHLDGERYLLAIMRDISSLMQAQKEITQLNTDLAAANRDLEEFGYTVAHDLKRILTTISSGAQLMEELCPGDDQLCRDVVGTINRGWTEMDRVINALFSLSRSANVQLDKHKVDLTRMAGEIVGGLRREDPDRQVEVVIEDGLVAWADPDLMRIVLDNLLDNAWKYTQDSPAPVIEIGVVYSKGKREYFVRDNGVGFPPTEALSIFSAFKRSNSHREFTGNGVGLATSRKIIERHGGAIRAEGESGRGATFFFTLSGR